MRFLALLLLAPFLSQALEYAIEFENDSVRTSRMKLDPEEEIGLHRDANPRIVIGIKGGAFTRFEADGSKTIVHFPTNGAIFLPADPIDQQHKGKNGNQELEILVIELKTPG